MFQFGSRSLANLKGVHPDLVKVMTHAIAICPIDFGILCGLRTEEEERHNFEAGTSQTMNSRHLTGHAVDIGVYIAGKLTWQYPYYVRVADAVKQAAKALNIPVTWGGDWTTLKDGGHFELPRDKYPAIATSTPRA